MLSKKQELAALLKRLAAEKQCLMYADSAQARNRTEKAISDLNERIAVLEDELKT